MNTQLICYTAPNDLIARWGLAVVLFIILCVLETAIKNKVAFVPGDPFYTIERNVNALRLNYTNANLLQLMLLCSCFSEALT